MWSSTHGCQSKCSLVSISETQNKSSSNLDSSDNEKNIAFAAGLLVGAGYNVKKVEHDNINGLTHHHSVHHSDNVNGLSPQSFFSSPPSFLNNHVQPSENNTSEGTIVDYTLRFANPSSTIILLTIGKCKTQISIEPATFQTVMLRVDTANEGFDIQMKPDVQNAQFETYGVTLDMETKQQNFILEYYETKNVILRETLLPDDLVIYNDQKNKVYLVNFYTYGSKPQTMRLVSNDLVLKPYTQGENTQFLMLDAESGETSGFRPLPPTSSSFGFYTIEQTTRIPFSLSLKFHSYKIAGSDLSDCSI